ncbi:hypothetical protein [Pelagimonas varians]|uniref:hypothetical protein n=1 Tax=Pelagimonas varians TaxID=696760 RepID=UPI000BEF0F45|nr:hypothetical protein [Pelagimonas varians]
MFPNSVHDHAHFAARQYGRLVPDWVTSIRLAPISYSSHSLRRTKAAEIYRKAGNLRAGRLDLH